MEENCPPGASLHGWFYRYIAFLPTLPPHEKSKILYRTRSSTKAGARETGTSTSTVHASLQAGYACAHGRQPTMLYPYLHTLLSWWKMILEYTFSYKTRRG